MLADCPNHKISEGKLLQTFYQGMTFENKHLMNSSSGGQFSRMRVSEARDLIQRLVEATREYDDPQWRRRGRTSEAIILEGKLEAKIIEMEKLLSNVADRVERTWAAEAMCTLCGKDGHTTAYCKMKEREEMARANAARDWHQRGPRRDPFSNTYNPGWRDHPNFRWREENHPQPAAAQPIQPPAPPAQHGPIQGGG